MADTLSSSKAYQDLLSRLQSQFQTAWFRARPAVSNCCNTRSGSPPGQAASYGLGCERPSVTLAGSSSRVIGHHGILTGGMVASLPQNSDHGMTSP